MDNMAIIMCFLQGQDAYDDGFARLSNPYMTLTVEARRAWDEGWLDASHEALQEHTFKCHE